MTSHLQSAKYRPDIDGLRALAIIPVVLFHAFPSRLPGGFIGVDVFFVISGFLISSIILENLNKQKFSFLEFYGRRILRLFPALSLVLCFTLVFGWFSLDATEFKMVGKHIAAGAGFVQNFVLWDEVGYFDIGGEKKPLLHLWSLAIEEQFYMFFPLLLWLAWRFGFSLIGTILVVAIASLAANLYSVRIDPNTTFYFPHTRVWELLAGSLLAAVAFKNRQLGVQNDQATLAKSTLSFIGFALILLAVVFIEKKHSFPGWRAMIPVLGAILIIYGGKNAWINRHLFSNKLIVFIGLISYPLYLWHWPLLSFVRIIESELPSAQLRIGLVILSVVLATLTYWLVEKPIRFGKSRRIWITILATIMAVLAAIGLLANGREITSKIGNEEQYVKTWEQMLPSQEDNCAEMFPDWNKTRDTFKCTILRKGKPKISVIGDSHSRRIHYGVAYHMGDDYNMALFPMGCAMPFYDISVALPKSITKEGYSFGRSLKINQALDFSINDPEVELILLTTSACWNNIVDITNLKEKKYGVIVEQKMRETLQRLTQSGKKILYVLDNPILDFDPKSCVSRPFRINTSSLAGSCRIDREKFDKQRVEYFSIARRVLAEFPEVLVFDVASKLCDEDYCYATIDDKLLYHDASHLGYYGSQYVGQYIAPIIEQALKEK